eukprot:270405_1
MRLLMLPIFIIVSMTVCHCEPIVIFQNITNTMNLSQLFIGENATLHPDSCMITNYVDEINQNQSYFWLTLTLMDQNYNTHSFTVNNIYNPDMSQYNESNSNISSQLPFEFNVGFSAAGCKSPLTNDIIECYKVIFTPNMDPPYFYIVQCHILYNNQINPYWSKPINVTRRLYLDVITIVNVLCFNDSYFITYSALTGEVTASIYYGVLDLNGKSIHYDLTLISADYYLAFQYSLSSTIIDNTYYFTTQWLTSTYRGLKLSNYINNYTNYTAHYVRTSPIEYILDPGQQAGGSLFDIITIYIPSSSTSCCYISSAWSCHNDDGSKMGNCTVWLIITDFKAKLVMAPVSVTKEINPFDVYHQTKPRPKLQPLSFINQNKSDHYFMLMYMNVKDQMEGIVYGLNDQRVLSKHNVVILINKPSPLVDSHGLKNLCSHVIDNGLFQSLLVVESGQVYYKNITTQSNAVYAIVYNLTLVQ